MSPSDAPGGITLRSRVQDTAADREAVAQLFREHGDKIYAFDLQSCRNPEDAQDLVQEGVNGHIVKVGDVEAIANHIGELADDRQRARQMGQKSLEIVKNWNFQEDTICIEKAVQFVMNN